VLLDPTGIKNRIDAAEKRLRRLEDGATLRTIKF
jgi:hypothetical protein